MARQSQFAFDLGDLVEDKVTKYKGIVISGTEWLNSCRRYTVQAQGLKDGKPFESIGLDEDNMILTKRRHVEDKLVKNTGGDQPTDKRAPDPRR